MLKIRIMPTLLFKKVNLVKGIRFDSWRVAGGAMQALKVYNMREVDELVFLDITATLEKKGPEFELIDDLADECFMPMTVGGGIRMVEDIKMLLKVGADKVAINTAAVEDPEFIRSAARKFGSQCIVVSIDFKTRPQGGYEVFTHSGTKPSGLDPVDFAIQMEKAGAGEILLTSIDRDGTMTGYDIALTRAVCNAVSIPVIASGGAGNYEHMRQALCDGRAAAVAAASIFHYTEQTPLEAKKYLASHGLRTRI